MKSFNWIEGNGEVPTDVMAAAYDTGAGKVICAVCEVSEALQRQGWPVLSWAYIDLSMKMMICRNSGQNISQHVVRWLPVDGAALRVHAASEQSVSH